jgi:hypothetical protein
VVVLVVAVDQALGHFTCVMGLLAAAALVAINHVLERLAVLKALQMRLLMGMLALTVAVVVAQGAVIVALPVAVGLEFWVKDAVVLVVVVVQLTENPALVARFLLAGLVSVVYMAAAALALYTIIVSVMEAREEEVLCVLCGPEIPVHSHLLVQAHHEPLH